MPPTALARRPFQIFSWNRPFLPAIKELIEKDTGGETGGAVVITPNNRPARYFIDLYRMDGKAAILPLILDYASLVELWSSPFSGHATLANQLDLAWLAWESVQKAAKENNQLAGRFFNMELESFLPWGFRLANLFEKLFSEGLLPKDIAFAENDVAEPAAQLLSSLGDIGRHWLAGLAERQWTTKGYKAYLAAQNSSNIPEYLMPSSQRRVYLAGFYELDGAQKKVFRSLWERGARVCLHADPDAAQGGSYPKWLSAWHAALEFPQRGEADLAETKIEFFSGYDLHSQLLELQTILSGNDQASTAIILNSPDSLIPVLHHLPQKDVNISIGYPIERTLLHNFLKELFALVKNRSNEGNFYWRDLLKLSRQPFLHILKEPENGVHFSNTLQLLEKYSRSGNKYISWPELFEALQCQLDDKQTEFLQKIHLYCIENLILAQTVREFARALRELGDFLLSFSADTWENYPMEAEALNRLQVYVLPVLQDNALKDEKLNFEALEGIFQNLCHHERIPFEADPLVGIQILGLLETRLLQFDNVIFIDANEDLLPGGPARDPLLPDSLAGLLGLPDRRDRDAKAEYNFFRLCAGARRIHLLWQEGVSRSGIFDDKKMTSRFVEQLLWREEKKRNKLLKPGDAGFRSAIASLSLRPLKKNFLKCSENIRKKLDMRLAQGISPTFVDQFYRCPLAFARSAILGLSSLREAPEGDDPPLVGALLHNTLREFYQPLLSKEIRREHNEDPEFFKSLMQTFERQLQNEGIYEKLPLDSCLMLEQGASVRFGNYLKEQPDLTRVLKLEWEFNTFFKIFGRAFKFRGIVDRLDERNGKCHVLDYKTFKLKDFDVQLWRDQDFFQTLQTFCDEENPDWDAGEELFINLRERLPSIQLPFYVLGLSSLGMDMGGAAYVDLYDTGAEKNIFGDSLADDELQTILHDCRILLNFVLKQLLQSPEFRGNGVTCEWCEFSGLCNAR